MAKYIYNPGNSLNSFAEGVEELQKKGYNVVTSCPTGGDILKAALKNGMELVEYNIDASDYNKYVNEAGYVTKYPNYYPANLKEKSFEHYIEKELLKLSDKDIFIDIASQHSPVAEIFSRQSGAKCYSQDIMFPEGIQGDCIGGDACAMPLSSDFASKAALSCSLEHFEKDADIRLFHELYRVLKPGGMVAVVPFYLSGEAYTLTDPTKSVPCDVVFDRDNLVFCREGWGNRHGRIYCPESFMERIGKPFRDKFIFKFYYLKNAGDVDPSIYARFAFTATVTKSENDSAGKEQINLCLSDDKDKS